MTAFPLPWQCPGARALLFCESLSEVLGQATVEVGAQPFDHVVGQALPEVAIGLELVLVKELIASRLVREGRLARLVAAQDQRQLIDDRGLEIDDPRRVDAVTRCPCSSRSEA
jgi:hypothetical protein